MGGYLVPNWRAVFRVCLVSLLCAGLANNGLRAASPPEWIRAGLAADLTNWKSADSVITLLDYQRTEYTGRDRVKEVRRGALRLVAEAGRTDAVALLHFNADTTKIRSARAWVISADGRKTRGFGQNDFVDQVAQRNSHFWNAYRLLHYDAGSDIEVGGVLAWEFETEEDSGISDTNWAFLAGRPTWQSVLEVVPLPGASLAWNRSNAAVPDPVPANRPGSLRWEMNRLEKLPEDRPNEFIPDPLRVSVRCVVPGSRTERLSTWPEFSKLAAEIVEPRMESDATVTAKAAELIAGQRTRWERIRALCEFAQHDISYLSMTLERDSLAGYRPRPTGECLKNRYGDCKDKAALLCAMLRAVGDQGYVTLVFSGNPKVVPADWPSACFNHAIAAIPADADTPPHWPIVESPTLGRLVIFDATDPVTPLGVLSDGDEGGHALLVAAKGGELVELPGETDPESGIHREITAQLTPDGVLQARGRERRIGSIGAASRRARVMDREEKFSRALQTRVRESLPLARNIRWTETWDAAASTHALDIEFAADRYARALGKERVMFNPLVLAAGTPLAAWKLTHDGTTWFAAQRLSETVRVRLPEGFALEELPKPVMLEQAGATCRVSYQLDGRELVTERTLVRPSGFFGRENYEALRALLQKVQETERRPVILKRVAAATVSAPPAASAISTP